MYIPVSQAFCITASSHILESVSESMYTHRCHITCISTHNYAQYVLLQHALIPYKGRYACIATVQL